MTLLHQIAAGDSSAIELFIDRYSGLVWSITRRYCDSRGDAEDAVQEIFIDVWKSASRFDSTIASEAAFVATIARRRLIDRLRRSSRRLDVEHLPMDSELPSAGASQEIELFAEAALAFRALKELRPERRRVLILAIYHGMSHQEIADADRLPLGTVKSHITRGLKQIRARLAATAPVVGREAIP